MKYFLLSFSKQQQYLLFVIDSIAIFVAVVCSYVVRMILNQQGLDIGSVLGKITPWIIVIISSHLFGLYIFDLYNLDKIISRARIMIMVVCSVLFAGLIIGAVFFFVPKYIFGRQVLLIHLVIVSILLLNWRLYFNDRLSKSVKSSKVAFVGSLKCLTRFVAELETRLHAGIHISALYSPESKEDFLQLNIEGIRFYPSLEELLDNADFDILIFDVLVKKYSESEIMGMIKLKHQGKTVFDLPSIVKILSGRVALEYIDCTWIVHQQSMQGQVGRTYIHLKRFFDIIGSLALLVLLLPLIILVAIMIRLDSKGPVLFKQKRLGRNKQTFTCLKFRSMIVDAEKVSGPVWAGESDHRITRIGRFIRKARIDEIPQLWNILRGEISFIGPRPIRKHFADMLSKEIPFYDLRFAVQPGLSGWAQVNHDYADSIEGQRKKFEYELFYIQNMSLFLDVIVFFKTIQSVFSYSGK